MSVLVLIKTFPLRNQLYYRSSAFKNRLVIANIEKKRRKPSR